MTDTQHIDMLLKRVNEIDMVITNKVEKMKTNTGSSFYNPFLKHQNDGYINIQPIYKTKFEFSDVRHKISIFMMNKNNVFDEDLYRMLKINIKFNKSYYSPNMGTYQNKLITINRAWMGLFTSNVFGDGFTTIRHEVGHAWHEQFSKILKITQWELSKLFLDIYLEKVGVNVKYRNFIDYKPLIKQYVSEYATKNNGECFAEIFELATQKEPGGLFSPNKKIRIAAESLRKLNTTLKGMIWND